MEKVWQFSISGTCRRSIYTENVLFGSFEGVAVLEIDDKQLSVSYVESSNFGELVQ